MDVVGLQVEALVLHLHLVAAQIHHEDLRSCEEDDLLAGELRKHYGMNLAQILGVAQFEGLEEFRCPDLLVPENLELLLLPKYQPEVGELITVMLVGCVHIHKVVITGPCVPHLLAYFLKGLGKPRPEGSECPLFRI